MRQPPPPDRRDQLLSDLHEDSTSLALPVKMAARIRRRRRMRNAAASLSFLAFAGLLLIRAFRPHTASTPTSLVHAAPTVSSVASAFSKTPESNIATDAELMTALEHESVMVFTLADGQKTVVWLDGRPEI